MGKELKGEIKAVDRAKHQVKIGADFHPYADNVGRFLNVGDEVQASANSEGVVVFVKKLGADGKPAPRPMPRQTFNGSPSHQIRRQACLNTAVALWKGAAEHGVNMTHPKTSLSFTSNEKIGHVDYIISIAERLEKWVLKAEAN